MHSRTLQKQQHLITGKDTVETLIESDLWPAEYRHFVTLSDIQGHSHIPSLYKVFGRPFVKRFALCYRTVVLSVLSVCDVGALWPNAWMDQDETWYAGRPRPWTHCVRRGPSSPSPIFSPSVVAKWLDGSRCHLVWRQASAQATLCQMGSPLYPPQKLGQSPLPNFRLISVLNGNPAPSLNCRPMFIIVIAILLEHCTKHSGHWFIQVQVKVLYSLHSIFFRKV